MKLLTALSKKFDVEVTTRSEDDTDFEVLEVSEKDDDGEYMFSLTVIGEDQYRVNNVYSTLENGTVLNDKEIKTLLKNNSIKSK